MCCSTVIPAIRPWRKREGKRERRIPPLPLPLPLAHSLLYPPLSGGAAARRWQSFLNTGATRARARLGRPVAWPVSLCPLREATAAPAVGFLSLTPPFGPSAVCGLAFPLSDCVPSQSHFCLSLPLPLLFSWRRATAPAHSHPRSLGRSRRSSSSFMKSERGGRGRPPSLPSPRLSSLLRGNRPRERAARKHGRGRGRPR